jgi:hypothetical protein
MVRAMQQDRPVSLTTFTIAHLVLLLLASTDFTLITAPLGGASLQWNFFGWAYANGWGYAYRSNYSFVQVCAYLLAYASGIGLYLWMLRPSIIRNFGVGICVAGVVSFTVELSHWVFDHNLSLIASFPMILIAIDIWIITMAFRAKPRFAGA